VIEAPSLSWSAAWSKPVRLWSSMIPTESTAAASLTDPMQPVTPVNSFRLLVPVYEQV
jgi:hypothetical protein